MTLTMNRADERNVLSADIINGLQDGLTAAGNDDTVRVVVITNTGSVFCAGADLKAQTPAIVDGDAPADNPFVALLDSIRRCPKPVVARVNGHATGGGVGLVAVCDLSVIREDALVGFTEVRVGVAPAIISVVCLPKMTVADASELMLTGERVSGSRAADVGLVNYAEPHERMDERVDTLCLTVSKGGPKALAATKALLQTVPSISQQEAFAQMAALSASLFVSEEATEGIAAFRQRRPPAWHPDAAGPD